MKRIAIALAAAAAAAVATVGIVRVTAGSEASPKPNTSENQSRQDLRDQAIEQAKQMKIAEADLARQTKAYAERHQPTTAP